jgi:hypothetical protein
MVQEVIGGFTKMSFHSNSFILGDNFEVFSSTCDTVTVTGGSSYYHTGSVLPANRGNFGVTEVIVYSYTRSTTSINVSVGYKYPGSGALNYINIVDSEQLPAAGGFKRWSLETSPNFLESTMTQKECVLPGGNIIVQNAASATTTIKYRVWIAGRFYK